MSDKLIVEVTSGASLNTPYTELTRVYTVDTDDWDELLEGEQQSLLAETVGEASGYAGRLALQSPGFWVRTELRWPS